MLHNNKITKKHVNLISNHKLQLRFTYSCKEICVKKIRSKIFHKILVEIIENTIITTCHLKNLQYLYHKIHELKRQKVKRHFLNFPLGQPIYILISMTLGCSIKKGQGPTNVLISLTWLKITKDKVGNIFCDVLSRLQMALLSLFRH